MKSLTERFDHKQMIFQNTVMQVSLLLSMIVIFVMASQNSLQGQELRGSATVLITASGESLPGFGIGVEAPFGKHFSTSIDGSMGFHRLGSTIMLKPSLNFYFSKKQKGIFIGPALNYIALKNKNDGEEKADHGSMFGLGFNFGGKGNLSEKMTLHVVFTPQASVGPFNGVGLSANLQVGVGFKL